MPNHMKRARTGPNTIVLALVLLVLGMLPGCWHARPPEAGEGVVADFAAEPREGILPLLVRFSNLSRGTITHYLWDFGDGTTSTERDPTHLYTAPGRFTVSLTVIGPGGSDTKVRTNYITVEKPEESWSCAPKVFLLIFNPILEADGHVSLVEYYKWNDPDTLAQEYIADVTECSYGQVRYQIAIRVELDEWPLFQDGFRYTDETYKQAWETRTMHEGTLDYVHYLDRFDIKTRVDHGEIDEVWIFGFPWGWTWESCMAGPNAIWINGPTLSYPTSRSFPIMGFNYERGVDCMLENLGHRAECVLNHVYNGGWWWEPEATHLWGLFTRIDKTHPGEAGCGNVHFAPNSESDYDWGNPRYVWSTCDDWLYNFPYLTGYKKLVNCEEWGNGDMRLHHKWWFQHFPHHNGRIEGKLINWWKYVIQWDRYGEIGP